MALADVDLTSTDFAAAALQVIPASIFAAAIACNVPGMAAGM